MRLIACLVMLAAGCQQFESWGEQIDQASENADADLDEWTPALGDCDESCDTRLYSPDGAVVCRGWYFHPMEDEEHEKMLLAPGLDQDCDGVTDGEQPGLDFDGDGFAGVPEAGEIRDCDDFNGSIRPSASETCGDNVDQDCDGRDVVCGEE